MDSIESDLTKIKELIAESEENRDPIVIGISDLGFIKKETDKSVDTRIITSSEYFKNYNNGEIIIKQQSIDRCKTFVVRPDGVRVELIIKIEGEPIKKENFGWREKAHPGEIDE